MLNHNEIKELIQQQGILPLFFHEDADVSVNVMKALYAAGIRIIEYTNRGEQALKNFKKLKEVCAIEYKDMLLGTGTIKSSGDARAFTEAGADFLISPSWHNELLGLSREKNFLWIPGCMTSTEIANAEAHGITLVKLFPGSLLGPEYVSAVKEVFPDMQFMPTGGVSLDKKNLQAWFASGVMAVGMGSKLVSKALMRDKDYSTIAKLTTEALSIVRSIRQ